MGSLIYSMFTSVDGYVNDAEGGFDWGEPSEQSHRYINELTRSVGTYLYGRRIYELMTYWETADENPESSEVELEWTAIWKAAQKIVYSTTLPEVTAPNTRLERSFDPEAVRALKEQSSDNLTIDGPTLAAHALRAGLVDEIQLFTAPIAVGGGTRFWPEGLRLELENLEFVRFDDGATFQRLRVRTPAPVGSAA